MAVIFKIKFTCDIMELDLVMWTSGSIPIQVHTALRNVKLNVCVLMATLNQLFSWQTLDGALYCISPYNLADKVKPESGQRRGLKRATVYVVKGR